MNEEERWLEERLASESSRIPLPPRERWFPAPREPRRIAAVAALAASIGIVVLALLVGTQLRALREPNGGAATAPTASPARPVAPLPEMPPGEIRFVGATVPSGWNLFGDQGVLIATPPEWGFPRRAEARMGPGMTGYLGFGPHSVWVWSESSVDRVVEERWVKGNLQPLTQRVVQNTVRRTIELVIEGIRWYDRQRGTSGTHQARHLFVQASADVVIQVAVTAPPVANADAKVSDEERRRQDLVATLAAVAPDSDRQFTRAAVEDLFRRTLRVFRNQDLGAGEANRDRLSNAAEEWVYRWDGGGSVAYVLTYRDRTALLADNQGRRQAMIAPGPVVSRSIGNLVVIVATRDTHLQYLILRVLNELAR